MDRHANNMEVPAYESDHHFVLLHNIGEMEVTNHWHNAIEIIMPIAGKLTANVNSNVYNLNTDDILIISSGNLHTLRSDCVDGQRVILLFDLQVLNTIRELINVALVYARHHLITRSSAPGLHMYIKKLLMDMLDEQFRRESYHEVSILCKIIDLSVRLSREQKNDESDDYVNHMRRRENIAKLNECIGYINTNYKDDISLDTAADAAGFSKFHFSRWFKHHVGISFHDFLSKVRMEKAEAMLLNSSMSMTEIAHESGFRSVATFNRIFKGFTDRTPTEYRNYHTANSPRRNGGSSLSNGNYAMDGNTVSIAKIPPAGFSSPGSPRLNSDGTFNNPFLWADIPDPDVIRVGDAYYMVSTTMYFTPHCPIMKSYDLVNWEIVNYACDILDDGNANALRGGANAYGKGTWAASLRYNKGTYYVTAASFTTDKTYIFQTEDIENGPWRRYEIDQVHHDQSLLFDDDGRVFLVTGAGKVYLLELTADATAVKPDGLDTVIIENADVGGKGGLPAEGSHFYKLNGYYYIFMIAWPPTGSGRRIQLCYRASKVEGPYEGRVILDDDIGFKNAGAAQGGIVDTPDGDWYAMLFQDHESVGRIPVLVPFVWKDGWPVLGEDGSVPKRMKLPNLKSDVKCVVASDEFYPCDLHKSYTAVNDAAYLYGELDETPLLNADRSDTEILINGNFENGTELWGNTYIASLKIVTDDLMERSVLFVSNRATTGSGPKYDVSGRIQLGGVYEVRALIKYTEGPPEKQFYISIFRDESWQSIQNMGSGFVKRGEWGEIRGTYTLPVDSKLVKPSIFIETPWVEKPKKEEDLMDFYVAEVSMIDKPMLWKLKTAAFENDPGDSRLPLVWQWNHNPDHNLWSLRERPGYLRLKSEYLCTDLLNARNTLTQRSFGPFCIGTAALDTSGMRDGDVAGLAALQELYGYVGVKAALGGKKLIMVNASSGRPEEIESVKLKGDRVYLRVDMNFADAVDQARFLYSEDEIRWNVIGDVLQMKYKLTHFTGYRFALFYYATQTTGGYADFDYFRVSGKIEEDEDLTVLDASFDGGIDVLGVHNKGFELPIHMSALPDGQYRGINMSFSVPERLDVEDVLFCGDNITGETSFEFADCRLRLSVTGEKVSFDHKPSALFATIRFRVKGFVTEDTTLTVSADYIHIDGGNAVYRTCDMNAEIRVTAPQTAAKAKIPGYANPLISHKYGADPWAMEYGGRLYLYLTGDKYEYSDCGRLIENTYQKIDTINVISSADLINWTDHGEIRAAGSEGAAKWAAHSWAPSAACKTIGGRDKFFLYFSNDASNIGVLTADSPVGPWTDPLGAPLIHRGIPGVKDVVWCFDPAVFVDDDGAGYLYFGGGLPSHSQEDTFHPRTARVIKLGDDMTSVVGEAVLIDAPALFEDSGINKINGKYYYSYCSNFVGERPKSCPAHGEIAYMISDDPMGPFTYAGTILKNPIRFFGVGGNNHHCIFTFKDKWYITYHAQTLGKALGKPKGYRSPHINAVTLTGDGRIRPIEADMYGVAPTAVLDPYKQTGAETMAWQAGISTAVISGCNDMCVTDIHDGDWLAVANVDFGSVSPTRLTARLASCTGGEIEIRLNSPDGELIGSLGVRATGSDVVWDTFSCGVDSVVGTHHLFFIFKGDNERNLFNFDHWRFER